MMYVNEAQGVMAPSSDFPCYSCFRSKSDRSPAIGEYHSVDEHDRFLRQPHSEAPANESKENLRNRSSALSMCVLLAAILPF